ncbi:MAG: hypothetical protein IPM25_14290 [Chloracidobacterium sp.]|nr:hypothetical protein [Chloracidobacterium sp.]
MKKNKYLLLISSLGVLALLVAAAISENFLKEWHAIQGQARTQEGPIDVKLRQIVNPDLRESGPLRDLPRRNGTRGTGPFGS